MTEAEIQALIDAARTSEADLVTWAELSQILEELNFRITSSAGAYEGDLINVL